VRLLRPVQAVAWARVRACSSLKKSENKSDCFIIMQFFGKSYRLPGNNLRGKRENTDDRDGFAFRLL
jgi:hypothetical protein